MIKNIVLAILVCIPLVMHASELKLTKHTEYPIHVLRITKEPTHKRNLRILVSTNTTKTTMDFPAESATISPTIFACINNVQFFDISNPAKPILIQEFTYDKFKGCMGRYFEVHETTDKIDIIDTTVHTLPTTRI